VTDASGNNTKEKILELLKAHPEGLTIESISNMIRLHRQTVTKYIFWLDGADVVYRRRVGSATLHYLKEYVDSQKSD